uniref:Uncharacterized protein n=1 Tax=Serratia phage Kevin TaxID=3161161 RepID=A0AAU8KZZ9_9CAUD
MNINFHLKTLYQNNPQLDALGAARHTKAVAKNSLPGLYICYSGDLGISSLRICGDEDVLTKDLIRGLKLSDFDGAPERLAAFFGIEQEVLAEASPAYVNQ